MVYKYNCSLYFLSHRAQLTAPCMVQNSRKCVVVSLCIVAWRASNKINAAKYEISLFPHHHQYLMICMYMETNYYIKIFFALPLLFGMKKVIDLKRLMNEYKKDVSEMDPF